MTKKAKPNGAQRWGASASLAGCAVGGKFYNGMEWLGAWLVDHAEGETITEELIHRWAVQAWQEHLKRHNPAICRADEANE